MAVRFHCPARCTSTRTRPAASSGGTSWAGGQDVTQGLAGKRLEFGAIMGARSILWSTVGVFALSIVGGLSLLAIALYLAFRRGRRIEDG